MLLGQVQTILVFTAVGTAFHACSKFFARSEKAVSVWTRTATGHSWMTKPTNE